MKIEDDNQSNSIEALEVSAGYEGALRHILTIAQRSRTRTKRLAFIEKRAKYALEGKPYIREDFDIPDRKIKSPAEYELEIRKLKDQILQYRDILEENRIWE